MKKIFGFVSILFTLIFSLSAGVMLSSCKSSKETYIDVNSANSHFQAFLTASNAFLKSKIQIYSENENVEILRTIVGSDSEEVTNGINDVFSSAVLTLKTTSLNPEIMNTDSSLIRKTANSIEIEFQSSSIKLFASNDFLSQQVTIKNETSTFIYEFVCEDEGKYKAQLAILLSEDNFALYQFNFNRTAGSLIVFNSVTSFTSIFENGVGETFADETGSSFIF